MTMFIHFFCFCPLNLAIKLSEGKSVNRGLPVSDPVAILGAWTKRGAASLGTIENETARALTLAFYWSMLLYENPQVLAMETRRDFSR